MTLVFIFLGLCVFIVLMGLGCKSVLDKLQEVEQNEHKRRDSHIEPTLDESKMNQKEE